MGLAMGVDLGTTFFKAALFSREGRLEGLGRVPVDKQEFQGTCELPVESFWRLLSQAVEESLRSAGARPERVSSLGYSSQTNSFVLLNRDGECLTPLILWPDLRAESLGAKVTDLWLEKDFLGTTGVGVSGIGFSPYKLDWFRQTQPALWHETVYIQTISDYLVYGLTGERAGDRSTASMTGLWDQRNGRWWREGLERLDIDPSAMSRPLRPGSIAGLLTLDGAARLGLCAGTPLVVGGLDHYMAAVGAGLGSLADACESTGTILACIVRMDRYDPKPACCVGPMHEEATYYALTFNETGTTNLDWYRDQAAPELSIPELVRLAEEVPPGCMGLRAKPVVRGLPLDEAFVNGGAPHGRGPCVRAILEASALALAGLVQGLSPDQKPERILATGGGARSEVWLQIKADMLGVEMVQVDCEEPACQGAALLALVASKQVPGLKEASAVFHRVKRRFSPDARRHARYLELFPEIRAADGNVS